MKISVSMSVAPAVLAPATTSTEVVRTTADAASRFDGTTIATIVVTIVPRSASVFVPAENDCKM